VYSFTSTDRSLSFGVLSKGTPWKRPNDSAGAAFGLGAISDAHAAYLNKGGIDGFIGDGKINRATESVLELFYSLNVLPPLWLSADFQHVTHPAYNADRGPVEIVSGRLHAEF
jgi:carbohydrate-selective porin OprB